MRASERSSRSPGRLRGSGSLFVALALALGLSPTVARTQGTGADSVALSWTAPGDDGEFGTAAVYELRMSPSPIDDGNWDAAAVVSGPPAALPAGTPQRMVVRGLTAGTVYYFAIKAADEAGNWSGLSNVVRWDWAVDTAPPAPPSGMNAVPLAGAGVRLRWLPNAEADLAGYIVYRSLGASEPFTALHESPVTSTTYADGTIPAGIDTAWYQVSARDRTGNESARSGAVRVILAAGSAEWALEPGYPNPSGRGTTVSIPLRVPPAAEDARIEIVNSVGQRVRRMDLGALAHGTRIVRWDGRNDSGREVAPGAYTAWLIAGSRRIGVRLVRVP